MSREGSKRYFSERDYAAPFGRYQSGNELGAPSEVLVGREDQRAHFIELLLRMGQRGAYLVTGQRGVGKTSFVHYCLAEYKEEVYERFLRSGVGRVMFWDHAGVLLLAFCLIFVLLMVSELMEILALATGWGKGAQPDILFGLVIIPLALICLYPLLYAREVIARILHAASASRSSRNLESIATVLTLSLAIGAFFVDPFGAPALSMSRLFLAVCSLYLWVQATSFVPFTEEEGRWRPFLRVILPLGVVLGACAFGDSIVRHLWAGSVTTEEEFAGNILSALIILGTGVILRAAHLARVLPDENSQDRSRWKQLLKAPAVWYLFFGLILAGAAILLFFIGPLKKAAWVSLAAAAGLSVLCAVFYVARLYLKRGNLKNARTGKAGEEVLAFHPQPLLVLAAKACLSIVVSLQLVHPVLDKWTRGQERTPNVWAEIDNPPKLREPTSLNQISSLTRDEFAAVQEADRTRELADRWESYAEQTKDLGSTLEPKGLTRHIAEAQKIAEKANTTAQSRLAEAALPPRQRFAAVFHGRSEELAWVLALFLALAALHLVEYEWIVRPFVREREDRALDPSQAPFWQDQQSSREQRREIHRQLARLTLPWMVFERWLPVLTVSVNLGFEKLDHRRVVHAMLAGLRDQYHRSFCAWNSSLANLGRLFGVLILMMLVTLAGQRWFSMPSLETETGEPMQNIQEVTKKDYAEICNLFTGRQQGPGAANWICKLSWGNSILHVLYYNLLESRATDISPNRDRHLLFYIFPFSEERWPPREVPAFINAGIHLRVYHLLLFLLFFLAGRWLLHHLPIFPYRNLLQRIDDTMDSLATRTSVTSTTGRWKPAQWLQGFFMDERVRQTEQDPVDPRTVEFVFLQILRDIQGASIQLPGGRNQFVNLPTPEINFVLDELDKIGTRVDPDEAASSGGAQQAEIINAERRRSMELHRLLADMKNLLSSAPARFIFVGGRNLHDEWLADQTARQPLLTNIFAAEVYLPSLLTDSSAQPERPNLSFQVESYVANQKERAEELYRHSWQKRWLPMAALPLESRERESFLQPETGKKSLALSILSTCPEESRDSSQKEGEAAERGLPSFPGERELVEDFLHFLTYRSLGNSKKLKELLAAFVWPAGRVIPDSTRWSKEFRSCDHVLFFGDTERFRIQLLARVYRHLTVHFEQALVRRDDKLVASVLYLTDFLFKFHRRAFAWSSLERADELVHIHRAPDLREVLEAIVAQWSERFLHPIRNGMYDFRFRSDMAREIEYISRQSAEEMAAFNFTLDESQTLKAAYETNISRLGNSKEAQDLVAGLGELHEFDQEYETARLYYRRAISMLDAELEEVIGSSPLDQETSRIEIIGGVPEGQEKARRYMTWGIARLRLMLQIGMTFEHSRNLERAEMEYQNARTLATSLLLAMLDDTGRHAVEAGTGVRTKQRDDRLHALKHLNILFQPLFAEIWVAEKLAGGVDTSTSLAEKELWRLRHSLPFVRDTKLQLSENPTNVKGSNFALIMTELHNKTGDLYFIKGRQLPKVDEAFMKEPTASGLEGYLLRAHYHYAVGLHEVRRFVTHRRKSSAFKLSLGSGTPTIAEGGWPDFVFRAAGGGFNDLAECLLGRLSLLALLKEWKDTGTASASVPIDGHVDKLVQNCTKWLESSLPDETGTSEWKASNHHLPALSQMHPWVGRWLDERPADGVELIDFGPKPGAGATETLAVSLGFSFVGARYLEQGGYLEDSGREMLKVCETVNHLLWWSLVVRDMALRGECSEVLRDGPPACWDYLFDVALHALKEADRLFRSSRRAEGERSTSLVGRKIPIAALTQACALGLAACRWNRQEKVRTELIDVLGSWLDRLPLVYRLDNNDPFTESLRILLEESLVRYSYPMINRLHTLRLLIDDSILGGVVGTEKVTKEHVESWASELLDLESRLNAPLHFTPLHSGTTCALLVLRFGIKDLEHAAERALLASQEMYSMRRAFYENISDLYYLYDDFNDRQLHFNHAIQMAGAELASLLRYRLSPAGRSKPVAPAPPADKAAPGPAADKTASAPPADKVAARKEPPRTKPTPQKGRHGRK